MEREFNFEIKGWKAWAVWVVLIYGAVSMIVDAFNMNC